MTRSIRNTYVRIFEVAAMAALCLCPLGARAQSVSATILGSTQPWQYVKGGLNTNFQFGATPPNVPSGSAPTIVSSANGLNFAAGSNLTITYVSGGTSFGIGTGSWDANGDPSYLYKSNDLTPFGYLPSNFVSSASYPVYEGSVIGTFTDASGAIVGSPFFVGDGPTIETIPSGGTQLQLGINDVYFGDNSGSLIVHVTGVTATPEPGTCTLLLVSCISGGLLLRRRHART